MHSLIPPASVATLAYWQRTNMPDRAFVFARSTARYAGAVIYERYLFRAVDACRLSRAAARERVTGATRDESHTWVLTRAVDAKALDGTERVLVFTRTGAVLVRVLAERGPHTYQAVRKADVSTDGVTGFVVGTTRARGTVAFKWSSRITVGV